MRTTILMALFTQVAGATEPTALELLTKTDDMMRGQSSSATVVMDVRTNRYERSMSMQMLSSGSERTLIRILSPEREAGTVTLKVDDNIWNYLPKVDRTMKIPNGMMGGRWMGSHFNNSDLVNEQRMSDDYTFTMTGDEGSGWNLSLTPKPDAPVVWGRVELDVGVDQLPTAARYFEEDGTLARTMSWSDVQDIEGRRVPMTMTLVPGDAPEEYTRLTYQELCFDVDIPANTFSLQALRQ